MLLCVTKKMLQFALIVIEQEFLFKCNPMVHSINCDVEGSIGNIQNIYCVLKWIGWWFVKCNMLLLSREEFLCLSLVILLFVLFHSSSLIICPPLNLFFPRLLIFSAPPRFLSFLRTVYQKCHNTAGWEKYLSLHLIGWGSFPVCGSADGSSLCQDEIRELRHAYATGLHIWSFL